MRIVAIIPARYASTRFPGKPLADLAGKPMIRWVYERTSRCPSVHRVVVATDDDRIRQAVEAFGGEVVMTRSDHPSGTDRLAEAAASLETDLVVNVQGDEPLIDPRMIEQAVAPFKRNPGLVMGTLKTPIATPEEYINPNVVKVVTDRQGFALYFSRAPIPYPRDLATGATAAGANHGLPLPEAFKHIGLYVYRKDFLQTFARLTPTALENIEKLEQLRALEHGFRIRVVETSLVSLGVDTPEDLERARSMIAAAGL